jgi:hypothetical protein
VALGVVAIAAGFYLWQGGPHQAAAPTDRPAPSSPKPPAVSDDPDMPNPKADLAIQAIANARRLASDGKFTEAEAELKRAEDAVPGMGQIKQARDDIAVMQTPQGQLRIQLNKADLAIERNDDAAASAALAKAEQLDPQSADIAPLKQRLQDLQERKLKHDNRVAGLLTKMREDISRGDFAGADDALNQAERIDVGNPDVLKARVELNRAHNEALKKQAEKPIPPVTPPQR